MDYRESKWKIIRSLLFMGIFLILHYSYDWFPNIVTKIISGTDESLYQHAKISFFSYVFLILIEFLIFNKRIENQSNYLFAQIFILVLIPWVMFILWYSITQYTGRLPFLILEILYANIITFLIAYISTLFGFHFENFEFPKTLKVVIIILLALTLSQFIIFTFELPWYGFFIDPESAALI